MYNMHFFNIYMFRSENKMSLKKIIYKSFWISGLTNEHLKMPSVPVTRDDKMTEPFQMPDLSILCSQCSNCIINRARYMYKDHPFRGTNVYIFVTNGEECQHWAIYFM